MPDPSSRMTDHSAPHTVMGRQPYDFGQGRDAAMRATRAQEYAENQLLNAARDFAAKEERYRIALAQEIVRQHSEESVAWSVAPDLARGDKTVARLRRDRDIAEGVREAMQQACWRRVADRKDTQRFIEWSMRRDLAEGTHSEADPSWVDRPVPA